MPQNLENVLNNLQDVRAKVSHSGGIQPKLRTLEQTVATACIALSQIDGKHARSALSQTQKAGEASRRALYGLLPGYFAANDRLRQRILGNSDDNINTEREDSQIFGAVSDSHSRGMPASNETIRSYGDRSIVPRSYEKYLDWRELSYLPSTYGIKEHKLECLDISDDIEWWKKNGKPYYDEKIGRKVHQTYYFHVIKRHGEGIANSAALNCLDDIPKYLKALANSRDSERCVQFLQNKDDVIKFDKVTRVCLVLKRASNGNATPITAFKINRGALHKFGKDPFYGEDLYMPHFEYKFSFKQWR
jgi:hypothetical protein